jgi:hypothetical protein
MTSNNEQKTKLVPHFVIAVILFAVLAAVFLWPALEPSQTESIARPVPLPEVEQPAEVSSEEQKPNTFVPVPVPTEVVLQPVEQPEPLVQVDPEPAVIIDTSDVAIKNALLNIANTPLIGRLLVNDSLLQRFVVSVTNTANSDSAPNFQPLVPPTQSFRIYQQADKNWIDAASYKRYTGYVAALETLDNEQLLALYATYLPDIQEIYSEIGNPRTAFSEVFVDALDELLDTPEIPTPVEVYSDSVMYKFKDQRFENLSLPQKQLLRMGPDNMRRVKAKLRELKQALQDGLE